MLCGTTSDCERAYFVAGSLKAAVRLYYVRTGELPTPDAGLTALLQPVDGATPVLDKLPNDPWGRPYQLKFGATPLAADVVSLGYDGVLGSEDDVASGRRTARCQSGLRCGT
jgi:general secretion pathway protein G